MNKKTEMIRIDRLDSFSEHPYIVRDDDAMFELADSICEYGVLIPIIVRPSDNGRYEIISGHRRKRACEIAGFSEIPAFVFRLDDDEAAILLVDSNIQRENLLPSEKAYAYRLKYEAIKHQGVRTSGHGVQMWSEEELGAQNDMSGRNARRYIRLTNLIFQLLDKVDKKIISLTGGVELSFLKIRPQYMVNDHIEKEECTVNCKQARSIRELAEKEMLDSSSLHHILDEVMQEKNISINQKRLKSYFPEEYSVRRCEAELWKILDEWYKRNGGK